MYTSQQARERLEEIRKRTPKKEVEISDLEDHLFWLTEGVDNDEIEELEEEISDLKSNIDGLEAEENDLCEFLVLEEDSFEEEENDYDRQRANLERRYGGTIPNNIADYWIGMTKE